jgi:hypothetical protein
MDVQNNVHQHVQVGSEQVEPGVSLPDVEFAHVVTSMWLSAEFAQVRQPWPGPTSAQRDGSARGVRDRRIAARHRLVSITPGGRSHTDAGPPTAATGGGGGVIASCTGQGGPIGDCPGGYRDE